MNSSVMGVIITYNPDIDLLEENLLSLINQIDNIQIYDNNSENLELIEKKILNFNRVKIKRNKENIGLPINYNKAILKAIEYGYDWILILDQDSVLPDGYIDFALNCCEKHKIAIVCPQYWDINLYTKEEFEKKLPKEPFSYIDRCISSGSLYRVSTLVECGGFDESLFIDYVDYDYCRTIIDNGYKILQINDCIMKHQIGRSRIISIFGKKQIIYSHSKERKYYFFRNRVYYARKHRLRFARNIKFYVGYITLLLLLVFEEDSFHKILASAQGMSDGFKMNIAKREFEIE